MTREKKRDIKSIIAKARAARDAGGRVRESAEAIGGTDAESAAKRAKEVVDTGPEVRSARPGEAVDNTGAEDAADAAERIMDTDGGADAVDIDQIVKGIMDADPTFGETEADPKFAPKFKEDNQIHEDLSPEDEPLFDNEAETDEDELPAGDGETDDEGADEVKGKEKEEEEEDTTDEALQVTADEETNTITITDPEGDDLNVDTTLQLDGEEADKQAAEAEAEAEAEEEAAKKEFESLVREMNLDEKVVTKIGFVFESMARAKAKKLAARHNRIVVNALDRFMDREVKKFRIREAKKLQIAAEAAKKNAVYEKVKRLVESAFGPARDESREVAELRRANAVLEKEIAGLRWANAALNEQLDRARMLIVFEQKTRGLSKESYDRVGDLLEGMDFKNLKQFEQKLNEAIRYDAVLTERKRQLAEKREAVKIGVAKKNQVVERKTEARLRSIDRDRIRARLFERRRAAADGGCCDVIDPKEVGLE